MNDDTQELNLLMISNKSTKSNLDISHGAEVFPIPYDDDASNTIHSSPGSSLQDSFKYVKTNVPGPGFDKEKFTEQFAGCDCRGNCTINICSCLQLFGSAYDGVGKLKVDILGALSKPVLECGLACFCDPQSCTNRTVQHGIKQLLYIFHTKDKGYGLMLDKDSSSEISSLSFVCEYAGEVIGDMEASKRMKETDSSNQVNYLIALREHVLGTEKCIYIDPHYIGNVGRFINHSCDPNLFMVPVRVNHQVPRLALFSRRNIKPGEELTFDYSGNSTVSLSSKCVTNDKSIHSQTCFCHSGTSSTSGNSSSEGIQVNKITQISHQSEMNMKPPRKKQKIYQVSCSMSMSINNTKSGVCDSSENHNQRDKTEDDVTLQQSKLCEMYNPKVNFTAFVKRKPCFCGSYNCTGFLPLDSKLLCG